MVDLAVIVLVASGIFIGMGLCLIGLATVLSAILLLEDE